MPVYEYECKACGRQFEYQQRMADPEKTLCEACGKEALERIISRTAFALKGGGWYKDLYASTKPEAAKSESGGESAAPAASTGDAAKPAAPAAATPAAATPAASTPAASTPTKTGGGTASS